MFGLRYPHSYTSFLFGHVGLLSNTGSSNSQIEFTPKEIIGKSITFLIRKFQLPALNQIGRHVI